MRRKSKWWIGCGVALMACSLILLLAVQILDAVAPQKAATVAARVQERLPALTVGVQDTYSSMAMPALEIEGENIVALLEIPSHGITLPVGGVWDTWGLPFFPRRFSGTVYDGSLIIGGRDSTGQLACLKELDIGDVITVTDMTGARFTYAVEWVQHSTSATAEVLAAEDADLTLFARTAYAAEYVILRCRQQ